MAKTQLALKFLTFLSLLLLSPFQSVGAVTSVNAWRSSPGGPAQMLKAETLSETVTASPASIDLRPEVRHQRIVGYGASLTEASVINLLKISASERHTLLRQLFDPRTGAALSFLRVPMGASDLSDGAKGDYTYGDTPNNEPDPELRHFSMARDQKTFVVLREIKRINPQLKLMINPWSAPAWMKDNRHLFNGNFESKYMRAFAKYFLKTLAEYRRHGFEVDYVGIQNEPGVSVEYPSMLMSDDQQAEFIRLLGRSLERSGFRARIIANDDNYAGIHRVLRFLADPATAKYIAATGFHCWSNDPDQANKVPRGAVMFETECGGNINSQDFPYDFHWWNRIRVIENANRDLSAVLAWNLVSDEFAGPVGPGPQVCKTCRGLAVIKHARAHGEKPTITLNPELYALMHVSKFVHPGASRIGSASNVPEGLAHTAFRNNDGSLVLLLNNWWDKPQTFSVRIGDRSFGPVTLATGEAMTIVISER